MIALPTNSCYVLACALGDKNALARIHQLRGVDDKHHFTLLCRDFAEMATYARVDDACFRLLKRNTPGQYTFILPATKVPRRLQHPKRSTIGIRLPNHAVVQGLLNEAQAPFGVFYLNFTARYRATDGCVEYPRTIRTSNRADFRCRGLWLAADYGH